MSSTNVLGKTAESKIIHECVKRGMTVCIPYTNDTSYDLAVEQGGRFERIQVKSTKSDEQLMKVQLQRTYKLGNNKLVCRNYTKDDFEWLAVHDRRTDECYLVPSTVCHNKGVLNLRLQPTKSGQQKGILYASSYMFDKALTTAK